MTHQTPPPVKPPTHKPDPAPAHKPPVKPPVKPPTKPVAHPVPVNPPVKPPAKPVAHPDPVKPVALTTRLNAKGNKVPPVVTHEGRQAFEVTYKKGQIHPGGTNCSMSFEPAGVFPVDQCRVKFSMWFADSFCWDEKPGHNVGGKLGGFQIGQGLASGGRYSTTGATYRITFHDAGMLEGYLYPQLKQAFVGHDPTWAQLDQAPALQKVSHVAAGVHIWTQNKDFKLHKGAWNDIEMFCALNTPGKCDGVMELVVNGVKKRLDCVRYRHDNAKLTGFHLGTFFGGGDPSFATPVETKVWFAGYTFSHS